MLRHVPPVGDARVLVDAATRDDAAVFQVSPDRAIVATLDFFTPIVDNPYEFGRIAAANAFSDLYAMGAKPLFALNLVGWPRDPQILELLGETLRGGSDVAGEAGVFVLGGHSVDDAEPKYGMVAIGEVHPDMIISNRTAEAGDKLILTKSLGTGILSTALKRDVIDEAGMAEAITSMTTLNRAAAQVMQSMPTSVHAATDITGFGFLGHLHNMTEASGMGATIRVETIPVFPGVRDLIRQDIVPGGTKRNATAAEEFTVWEDTDPVDRVLLNDAQTSGGLVIAVAPEDADALLDALHTSGITVAAQVGELTEGSKITVVS